MKRGDILNNGARVIEYRETVHKKVVLADCGGWHPYVTWFMDKHGDCFWGHYFKDKAEAVTDFYGR